VVQAEMTDSKPYTIDRAPPDFLDGTMTRSEIVTVLESMQFSRSGGSKPVELDADVRDYLVGLLRR
jgi:hypothetical protein